MSARAAIIVAACAALTAAPAFAQPPPEDEREDAIDQLLREVDPEAPEIESETPPARTYIPPRPVLTEPVFIHETGKAPDGPPSASDAAYDQRLRASAATVRSFQGPMEGAWTLSAGGRDVYALQLIDRGGWIDGAWRDLRRPGALEGSGFIEGVPRTSGGDLTFRLSEHVVATLRPAGGRWTGQLSEGERREAVTLVRRGP